MSRYTIPFVGLKNGKHSIEFELKNDFFAKFPNSLIQKADLIVGLELDKKDSFMMLNFQVDGTAELTCDRCSELFDYEMIFDFHLIVKFAERENKIGDEDDVIYLPKSATHLELAEVLYDYIHVNIPIQVTHPTSKDGKKGCSEAILEKLIQLSANTDESEEVEDPRWAALKKLKES